MQIIHLNTSKKDQMIDITSQVSQKVRELKCNDGAVVIFTPHTTAGITINENADPDVVTDMFTGFTCLGFEKQRFRHCEGNSPAHLKSTLVGCSETIIVEDSKLVLGTWQGIYFCEFDGPRNRKVYIKVV